MEVTSTHNTKTLLTVEDAAAYFSVSPLTVYEWVKQAQDRVHQGGATRAIQGATLEKWIEKNTFKPMNHQAAA